MLIVCLILVLFMIYYKVLILNFSDMGIVYVCYYSVKL